MDDLDTIKKLTDNQKLLLEALEKSLGVVTTACKAVGFVRQSHYNWLKENDEYRNAVEDIQEIALDFAESELHRQIKAGEVSSTIFYLKTKGKKRGYIERQEFDIPGKELIIRMIPDPNL